MNAKTMLCAIAAWNGGTLVGADLRDVDLRWADLRGVNLVGAAGIILLPACDARGYAFAHAIRCGDEWRIRAGCRDFSISGARAHWGPRYKGDREQGDIYLHAIDWLEAKLARMAGERHEQRSKNGNSSNQRR